MSPGCVADILEESTVSFVRVEVRRKRKFLGYICKWSLRPVVEGEGLERGLGQWEQSTENVTDDIFRTPSCLVEKYTQ